MAIDSITRRTSGSPQPNIFAYRHGRSHVASNKYYLIIPAVLIVLLCICYMNRECIMRIVRAQYTIQLVEDESDIDDLINFGDDVPEAEVKPPAPKKTKRPKKPATDTDIYFTPL